MYKPVIYSAIDCRFLALYESMVQSLLKQLPVSVDVCLYALNCTHKEVESLPDRVKVIHLNGEDFTFKTDTDGKPFQNCPFKITLIENLIYQGYTQALWLDADILVTGNIDELLIPMGDVDLKACLEFPFLSGYVSGMCRVKDVYKSLAINGSYFNSGVMSINLKTAAKFVAPIMVGEGWRDQECLNHMFRHANVEVMDPTLNWKPEGYGKLDAASFNEHMLNRFNAKIIHFAGKAKPTFDNTTSVNKYELEQLEGLL